MLLLLGRRDWTNGFSRYAPLIGRRIKALIWMPMTSDTPALVSAYKSSSFSFTGAVFIAFEPKDQLFLTWRQKGGDTFLGAGTDFAWNDFALDRVRCDPNETWGAIEGGTLASAELFSAPSLIEEALDHTNGRADRGVRHEIDTSDGRIQFWIGTGGEDFVGDNDDMWVGVGLDPPNVAELTKLTRVTG
ncbi:hypothetical protein ACRAWD_10645 [Caulobacter segnis]